MYKNLWVNDLTNNILYIMTSMYTLSDIPKECYYKNKMVVIKELISCSKCDEINFDVKIIGDEVICTCCKCGEKVNKKIFK